MKQKRSERLFFWLSGHRIKPIAWLPRRLKEQFGAEIEEVFVARLEEAAGRGCLALLAVFLRELLHLPSIHAREIWFRQPRLEATMLENLDSTGNKNRLPSTSISCEAAAVAAWALPFLLFGTALTALELTPAQQPGVGLVPPFSPGVLALLAALTLTLTILVFRPVGSLSAGWFNSLGLALAAAWYLSGLSSWGKPLGSWVYLGFAAVALAAAARGRSLRALWAPIAAIRRDWSHLSFLLYSLLAFLLLTAQLDSVKGATAIPNLMGQSFIFALGAMLAQRVSTPLRRVLLLDAALALVVAFPLLAEILAHPDQVPGMQSVVGLLFLIAFWLGTPFVPGLVALLLHAPRHTARAERL